MLSPAMSFHLSSVIRRKLAIISLGPVWPKDLLPLLSLRVAALDRHYQAPLGKGCFWGPWQDYLEIVIWLAFRLHTFTREGVAFSLPWFNCPSASSVRFQCRKDSVRSDRFCALT